MAKPYAMLQVEYFQSPLALHSAQRIVAAKCRNMIKLLHSRLPYARKAYPDRSQFLKEIIIAMERACKEIMGAADRQQLMLIEARIAHLYWPCFGLLARHPDWQRIKPGGTDPLNKALNIGYSFLCNTIKKNLITLNLLPEIGILHSPVRHKDALAYDLEEMFRQPLVDRPIMKFFSKKDLAYIEPGAIIWLIQKEMEKKTRYKGVWRTGTELLMQTCRACKKAIVEKQILETYQHSWSHWVK